MWGWVGPCGRPGGDGIAFLQDVSQGNRTRATIKDSVAQFGAHVRTSGRLPVLQASKARERPLATGRLVLLARTQPTVDAHQIDGRRDLQVVQVHLVLSPVARLSQSLGAHSLSDGGF